MKRCIRCIKWLIDWFTDWIGQFDWYLVVGFAISGLLGIALTLILFVSIDTVSATQFDYEQLEGKVNVIQQNLELLLKTDCDININVKIITVKFEDDECNVVAIFLLEIAVK